jgi:hypothetical protein
VDPQPHRNGIHDVEGGVNALSFREDARERPYVREGGRERPFVREDGRERPLFVKTGVNALCS